MKKNHKLRNGGFTLVEISLVIALLIGLMIVLFFGIGAYTNSSDRARCIMNLVTMQKAMRSFENMYQFQPGDDVSTTTITGLQKTITGNVFGTNNFISVQPTCPLDKSTYTPSSTTIFPAQGTMWMTCPNGTTKGHVPSDYSNM